MAILLKFPKNIILEGEYIIFKPGVTEEEFWKLSNEDSNYELIDGVLVIHSPPSEEHEDIFHYLSTILRFYLEETQSGRIYGSRFVMRLSEKWNPEPDLMIITPKNYVNIKETRFEGPADIVIEILSKATEEVDLTKKLPKYLEAGVREVWIIDPHRKKISIHTKTAKTEWTNPDSPEKIISSVLKDLPFQINWVWNRKENPTSNVIKKFLLT